MRKYTEQETSRIKSFIPSEWERAKRRANRVKKFKTVDILEKTESGETRRITVECQARLKVWWINRYFHEGMDSTCKSEGLRV